MAGDFTERMDMLAAKVGVGTLTAVVQFDQPYAHRQHEDLAFRHVVGGAKYLERALIGRIPENMEMLAASILTTGPTDGMIAVSENVARHAADNAPRRVNESEGAVLANSDHPLVLDNGDVIYDRPAQVPRADRESIKERNEALQLDKHHWYGRWPRVIGEK